MYKRFIKNNYREILDILNCLKVGVYIADGKGNTLCLNDESCKTGGLTREEVLGKNMRDLEDMGFVADSITLRTLESGQEEEMIQNLGDGGKIYVTGTPLYNGDKIDLVISTERDITETLTLRELLKERDNDHIKIKEEIEYLKRQNITMWGNIIAEDEETRQLAEKAMRIAGLDATVLLTGESGTGKEVFANFIYQNSKRVGKPFIKVNCAAIPENLMESELFGYEGGAFTGADKKGKMGLFEMANTGTLFLDEIGELPIHLQSKLLRVLQEREIMRVGGAETIPLDIRLIAATNMDLKKAIEEGVFRGDLYYRLNIMPLELLPLRGRKRDIRALALYFVEQFNKEYRLNKGITEEAIFALQNFDWPGNIRELENIMERIMISFDGDRITRFQVERAIGMPMETSVVRSSNIEDKSMTQLLEEYEKYILETMMGKHKRASDVARALKMNKSTLSRRLKKYDLD
ncbi:MAG: sigma 54-interacting transcriptional regulator [Firmicutes bacterium]|jgi:PAS domain S-box-containing protein|nr:sigma 54-interacting transcriptional regulator [Bacillota bacterium]NBI61617.1 PAS domain S-box protein [Clostridiales bacterium]